MSEAVLPESIRKFRRAEVTSDAYHPSNGHEASKV